MTTQNPKATAFFEQMKKSFLDKASDEEKERYQRFGEKFYNSFDVEKGEPFDPSVINMEEALAYVVESLKSGLHPKHLTEDEQMMMRAGYGEEWFKNWGYTENDLKSKNET